MYLLVFFFTYLLLSLFGFVPESMNRISEGSMNERVVVEQKAPIEPERIVIPEANVDVEIRNPQGNDIATLDAELKKGAVHYPGSALLNEGGNMFLFGHSSYLPIVHNRNYKAFNNLQKLKEGDSIYVYAEGLEYRYRVTSVALAQASEVVVDLRKGTGKRLTLSTCNSFGDIAERYIVEADFVGSYPIAS